VVYETKESVNNFTIFDLPYDTPIVKSVINETYLYYNITLKKPIIQSGPTNVILYYELKIYNKSNIENEDIIDSIDKCPEEDFIFFSNDTEGDNVTFSVELNESNYYIAASAISNETINQTIDYKLIILTAGKYYGDTNNNDYTSINTFNKSKTVNNKFKWWIILIILVILLIIIGVIIEINKKLKGIESNKKLKNKNLHKKTSENKDSKVKKIENHLKSETAMMLNYDEQKENDNIHDRNDDNKNEIENEYYHFLFVHHNLTS